MASARHLKGKALVSCYSPTPVLEQIGERWWRRIGAGTLTAIIILLALWFTLFWIEERHEDIGRNTPVLVTLLPLPERPVASPPVPPAPQRVREVDAADGRQRQEPMPDVRPQTAPRAPLIPDVPDSTLLPPTITLATSEPIAPARLARADGVGGGPSHVANRGDGAGIGPGTGSGNGVAGGELDGPGPLDVLRKADWVWKPGDSALQPFAPRQAVEKRISGKAVLACRVLLSTRVHDCRVIAESAGGFGFGKAALTASRIFRVHPPRRNGKPLNDAWVGIPVVWITDSVVKMGKLEIVTPAVPDTAPTH